MSSLVVCTAVIGASMTGHLPPAHFVWLGVLVLALISALSASIHTEPEGWGLASIQALGGASGFLILLACLFIFEVSSPKRELAAEAMAWMAVFSLAVLPVYGFTAYVWNRWRALKV
ncbi:hypothetical protein [Xanthomonas arboricola]|uniref:Membrane-anchored protein n=1 Tax=Xanthomonas arboricola TaxID=56448 RepID=A0AB73H273_9XANT|nr:hypothetical protein [Xanthomonas arboricola]MBB5672499.1 putative membrane-anchored protein [Xanthomonas arboricola]